MRSVSETKSSMLETHSFRDYPGADVVPHTFSSGTRETEMDVKFKVSLVYTEF